MSVLNFGFGHTFDALVLVGLAFLAFVMIPLLVSSFIATWLSRK